MNRRSLLGWLAAAVPFAARGAPAGAAESAWLRDGPSDRDVANVKDYGAVGDGSRDDGPPIQRAVDAARAGKPVLFPAGRYRIRKPIVLHDDLVLLGYGRHSILWCAERGTDAVLLDGAKRVFLEGVSLDGDGSNRDGIVIHRGDDVRLRRCWIKGMGRRGVSIEDTPCVIMDSTVELCGEDGVLVLETNSGDPAHIVACYIFQNGGHGLHFTHNANQAMISDSEIILNGGAGIRIDTASKMISIVGNSILGNGSSGIDLEGGSDYNSIVSNVLSENQLSGISIHANCTATVLTANRLLNNCRAGRAGQGELVVQHSTETVLIGNIFAQSSPSTPPLPGIVADSGSFASALGNVFRGVSPGD